MRLRRGVLIIGVAGSLMLAGAVPALADDPFGSVVCSQTPSPECELGAGQGGTHGETGRVNPSPGRTPGGHDDNQGTNSPGGYPPEDRNIGPSDKTVNCSYLRSDYHPPPHGAPLIAYVRPTRDLRTEVEPAVLRPSGTPITAVFAASVRQVQGPVQPEQGSGAGAWYLYTCSGTGFVDAFYRPPIWIPDRQQPGVPTAPPPVELALIARSQLRLPGPTIVTNPYGDQLVGLPTWLWLSGGWERQSATASVPGVEVTAVATPTSTVWSMGDGSMVTCHNRGTPFPGGGDPMAASPDCGHTYRSSSAGQPNNAYPVLATVHWSVSWSGAGQAGTFPDMTTTTTSAFRVAESQALNTG